MSVSTGNAGVDSKTWEASDEASQVVKDTFVIGMLARPYGAGRRSYVSVMCEMASRPGAQETWTKHAHILDATFVAIVDDCDSSPL